ncbi:MAG: hypothetical protein GF416_01575 [Candidatus Altiarchaeales archaeon]|nr:hypothetical protein [Candidatus Altiarchaeales archaeon]MBD3415805.1 hypothetical protein [Candidatus Altiarchaeales archaeon]
MMKIKIPTRLILALLLLAAFVTFTTGAPYSTCEYTPPNEKNVCGEDFMGYEMCCLKNQDPDLSECCIAEDGSYSTLCCLPGKCCKSNDNTTAQCCGECETCIKTDTTTQCCPLQRKCGGICCPAGEYCVGGACCPEAEICPPSSQWPGSWYEDFPGGGVDGCEWGSDFSEVDFDSLCCKTDPSCECCDLDDESADPDQGFGLNPIIYESCCPDGEPYCDTKYKLDGDGNCVVDEWSPGGKDKEYCHQCLADDDCPGIEVCCAGECILGWCCANDPGGLDAGDAAWWCSDMKCDVGPASRSCCDLDGDGKFTSDDTCCDVIAGEWCLETHKWYDSDPGLEHTWVCGTGAEYNDWLDANHPDWAKINERECLECKCDAGDPVGDCDAAGSTGCDAGEDCCYGECFDPKDDKLSCCGDACKHWICPTTDQANGGPNSAEFPRCCQVMNPGKSAIGDWRCCDKGKTCCGKWDNPDATCCCKIGYCINRAGGGPGFGGRTMPGESWMDVLIPGVEGQQQPGMGWECADCLPQNGILDCPLCQTCGANFECENMPPCSQDPRGCTYAPMCRSCWGGMCAGADPCCPGGCSLCFPMMGCCGGNVAIPFFDNTNAPYDCPVTEYRWATPNPLCTQAMGCVESVDECMCAKYTACASPTGADLFQYRYFPDIEDACPDNETSIMGCIVVTVGQADPITCCGHTTTLPSGPTSTITPPSITSTTSPSTTITSTTVTTTTLMGGSTTSTSSSSTTSTICPLCPPDCTCFEEDCPPGYVEMTTTTGEPTTSTTATSTSSTSTTSTTIKDCCESHSDTGCQSAACQFCVCAYRASCCQDGWSDECVSYAYGLCSDDCSCPLLDCCESHEQPRCDNPTCESCVDGFDDSCMDDSWGQSCVVTAYTDCFGSCGCEKDDCCSTHQSPGCTDSACETCVCDVDSDCCGTEWDSFCTDIANNDCDEECQCVTTSTTTTLAPTTTSTLSPTTTSSVTTTSSSTTTSTLHCVQLSAGSVGNQGSCGSCWAFSLTGTMEGVASKEGVSIMPLSEQYLVSDCCQPYMDCDGGFVSDAIDGCVSLGGVVSEACYPYTGADESCPSDCPGSGMWIERWRATGGQRSAPSVSWLKSILETGPVSIDMPWNCVRYTGYDVSDEYGVDEDVARCSPGCNYPYDSEAGGWHAMVLAGYCENPKDPDIGYWIIKNSWGPSWVDGGISSNNGYVNIEFDECGTFRYVVPVRSITHQTP